MTLALHVDYWNRLGWNDEYSSPLFSQRQEFYAQKLKVGSVYTPQMIVDGAAQFTGSDTGKAAKAITEAAKTPKGKVELTKNQDKIIVRVADFPAHAAASVFLAIAEDGLVSNVARGENSGKTLEHQSVVRELRSIGVLQAADNRAEIETALPLQSGWKKENLKIIVFVQENESRRILGVGRIAWQ